MYFVYGVTTLLNEKQPNVDLLCQHYGDLGGTLTHDTQNRNLMLYTTELQGLALGTVNN